MRLAALLALVSSLAVAEVGKKAGVQSPAGVAGSSRVTATGGGPTRTLSDWEAFGPVSLSSTVPTPAGTNAQAVGAKGDGSTDDASKIMDALMVASTAGGGTVLLPRGTYIVNSQIVVPNKVRLVGEGSRATIIKAGASFPTSTAVLRLGPSGATVVFGSRLENLQVNANNIAGSIGVLSTNANEGSGVRGCLITRYRQYGIDFHDNGSETVDHFLIDDVELYASDSGSASEGLRIEYLRNGGMVRRLTVKPNGGVAQATAVHLLGLDPGGSHVLLNGLNIEEHTDGVLLDTNASATIVGAQFGTSGTNLVRIVTNNRTPMAFTALFRATGTNTILNENFTGTAAAITAVRVPYYVTSTGSSDGYEVFTSVGQTNNHGNVRSNATTAGRFLIKSDQANGAASRSALDLWDGQDDGWRIRFLADDGADALDFAPVNGTTVATAVAKLDENGRLEVAQAFRINASATLATCAAGREGDIFRQSGGTSGARTKLCLCTSDGAGSPTYAWKNISTVAASEAASIGNTTTCP